MIKSLPGTYALVLNSDEICSINVGRLGKLELIAGYYVYIGSAFGPGGVAARLNRHCRISRKKHWHIDYLRERTTPFSAWCSYETRHLEHEWAQAIIKQAGIKPVTGFGSTDCCCSSHLFYTNDVSLLKDCRRRCNGNIETYEIETL